MEIGKILRDLCTRKGVEIIEAECCPDHIHMLVSIPPKLSVSYFMGYLKGKSSLIHSKEFFLNIKLKSVCFIINEDCNNKCIHCYNSYLTRRTGFMSREIFLKGLDDAVSCGVNHISISGGEALLHPDILFFIDEVGRRGLHFRLYTNGQLISDEICQHLKRCDLSPVAITLYSCDASVHDSISQITGSMDQTLQGISLLKKYDIPYQISVPIMKNNFDDFEKTYSYCINELGDKHTGLNPFISYTVNHRHSNKDVILSEEEMKNFAKRHYFFSIANGINILPTKKDTNEFHLYNGSDLTIQYDGTIVAGTLVSDIILGNVINDSLSDVLNNSEILREWRSLDIQNFEKCRDCNYLHSCNPNIGDNWVANKDIYKLNETWCKLNKAYWETLKEISCERFCVEVNGMPGFLFYPDSATIKPDGKRYAEAFFSEKIAIMKYGMDESFIKEEQKKVVLVLLED